MQHQRDRWYKSNIKIVPNDIELTIPCLYWWFVGDGYRRDYSVVLCTDAFSKEDKELLIKKFNEIGFNDVHITKNEKRLYVGSSEAGKFLNLIRDNYNISEQYKYKFSDKWKIKKDKV